MKKVLFTQLAIVTILAMLAACGPAPTPEVVEKVVKETVVVEKEVEVQVEVTKEVQVEVEKQVEKKLVIYNSMHGDPMPREADEELVQMFEEKYPDVDVVHSIVAHEDFKQAIRAYLTASTPPDVMTWFAGNRARFFIDKGLIMDISDVWESEGWNESYPAGFRAMSSVDDKQYFLPASWYWWAIYYRKDIFDQYGLEPPETWEELIDDLSKLVKKDQWGRLERAAVALGTAKNIHRSTDILCLLMLQNGTQMVNENKESATFDRNIYLGEEIYAPGQDALRFYTDFSNPSKNTYTWNSQTHYSIDAFVEGVHFDRAYTSFYQVGWKAMAANLSDIAAMGGRPSVAVVSLTVPGDLTVQDIEALYQGIEALGGRFGCDTVGGDTTSSPGPIVLSIAVLGKVGRGLVALRSAARVGDQICVTGHLGGAAAGLEVLQRGSGAALRKREREAARRHLEPLPRVREAEGLTQAGLVHAMIDISDGLASDLHHICRQSKVGAKILEDRIPIDSSTEQIAQGCRCSALDFALSGGEDFELLFTSGSEDLGRCSPDVAFSVIGEIVERQAGVVLCKKDGTSEQLPASGYVHFAGGT